MKKEENHVRIFNLFDTVDLMSSPDYKERFLAEYYQLRLRLLKLGEMLSEWDHGTLNFTPTCARELYDFQFKAMEDYYKCLRLRAKIEGIDI